MYAPFSADNANTLPPIGSFELALCFMKSGNSSSEICFMSIR